MAEERSWLGVRRPEIAAEVAAGDRSNRRDRKDRSYRRPSEVREAEDSGWGGG